MALPPKFSGHRLPLGDAAASSAPHAGVHTIELYLDYVCPFSAKMFKTVANDLAPKLNSDPALASKIQIIFRQQIQPWHPSSTLVHEAAVAVLRLAPSRFWDFSGALFAAQKDYFDVNVVNEPRNQTYRRLARLAADSAGVKEDEVYGLLAISDKPGEDGSLNSGNGVTADLKVVVKMARLVGVHVSPTVILDGVVANEAVDVLLLAARSSYRAGPASRAPTTARFFSSSLINQTPRLTCRTSILRSVRPTALKSSPLALPRSFSKSTPRLEDAPKQPARFLYPESLVIYHGGAARTTFLGMLKFAMLMGAVFVVVIIAPALYRSGEPLWKPAAVITCAMIPLAFTLFSTSPQVAFVRLRLPRFARASPELLRRYAEAPPANAVVEVGVLNFHGKPRVVALPLARLSPTNERFGLVNWTVVEDAAETNKRLASAEGSFTIWHRLLRRPLKKLNIRERGNDAKEAWVWDAVVAAVERRNR
ncbi:hypothetical protein M0657_007431 [Pyricularia oryzae]|nr:hypothetical protein M0657_007431 [Pyricularia oryzae]KAI7919963.1 hypothetical protein M9X92_006123 [Pyricularia oryzae]